MKRNYLLGLVGALFTLVACNSESEQANNNISEGLTEEASVEDVQDVAADFSKGLAKDGREYFAGLLAAVIEVDLKFKEVDRLDDADADKADIEKTIDATLTEIEKGRKSLSLYTDKNWPLRADYQDLTEEWFTALEGLINDHLYALADQLSRPELDTWTDDEWTAYENYLVDFKAYYEVDKRWVDFQQVFADSNDFKIGEPIDEEAMVDATFAEDSLK